MIRNCVSFRIFHNLVCRNSAYMRVALYHTDEIMRTGQILEASVTPTDLLLVQQWITKKLSTSQIHVMHMNCCNLAVFIGGVIVDTRIRIAAGGIESFLITPLSYPAATIYLLYRT